ncbi:MAG: OmpH family outer membrane protein [Bacteroidota bacterium]
MNNLKKSFLLLTAGILVSIGAFAQKYAYVDTQYILDNISEYKAAQQQLDQVSINWQKEIEAKYTVIDKLYKDYQAEQILLTEEMKRKREAEITTKEKEVKEFQKQKFGFEGELFKKKQELVKPIQDKIFNAVKKMATDQGYAVIFDKSSELIMLYTNPKYDKSDDILLMMGYKAGNKPGSASGSAPAGNAPAKSMDGAGEEKPTERK